MKYVSSENLANGYVILPTDVERELIEIMEEIERGTAQLADFMAQLEVAETNHTIQMAREMLRSREKSEGMRKADAMVKCEEGYRQVEVLKAKVRLCRDSQHDLRARGDMLRSVGASVRSSMDLGGSTSGGTSGSRQQSGPGNRGQRQ